MVLSDKNQGYATGVPVNEKILIEPGYLSYMPFRRQCRVVRSILGYVW